MSQGDRQMINKSIKTNRLFDRDTSNSATKQRDNDDESHTMKMKTQTKLVANLHSAANEGKVELVRLLLRCGADVNAQDEQFGNTALHQASWKGFSETVQVLCKHRANTSIKNKAQFTPLHMACQQGHNQTVRLLLMANAKTEAKNSDAIALKTALLTNLAASKPANTSSPPSVRLEYGDTPLHTAARYGHAGAARILLSAKCNPNQVNKNHDTPLHIAAAMGRRKLTKIFMQNGAEPAIKNKQNETPMDIALRKDLIDIQELIANPPPARTSAAKCSAAAQTAHAHLSQLEQRYGQLYAAGRRSRPQQLKQQQQARQTIYHRSGHTHLSSEANSSELEHKFAHVALHSSSGGHVQLTKTRRHPPANELAVDVVDTRTKSGELIKRSSGEHNLVTSRGNGFSSVHSLSVLSPEAASNRHLRTKTIASGSGADLHLSPALLTRRAHQRHGNTSATTTTTTTNVNKCVKVQSSVNLNQSCGEACPPDARDKPNEWADIMAKSALYRSANSQPVLNSLEDGKENDDDHDSDNAEGNRAASTQKLHPKSTSPTTSLRSSLSKSRGRLIVRRRKQKASLLVRRPNLGTCVGKLSLLRLRNRVQNRAFGEDVEERKEIADNDNDNDGTDNGNNHIKQITKVGADESETKEVSLAKRPAATTGGRRQERMRTEQQMAVCRRAPNGTQLQATRPLASLADDTQLYAIPKKSKPKQQVVNCDSVLGNKETCEPKRHDPVLTTQACNISNQPSNNGAHAEQTVQRVPSSGPALTSDGGHSSADSSASSFARLMPPSSSSAIGSSHSSDDCIQSMDIVCVNKRTVKLPAATDIAANNQVAQPTAQATTVDGTSQRPAVVGVHMDADLWAPGYSVISERPATSETTEPCLCQPYGQQQQQQQQQLQMSDKSVVDNEYPTSKASKLTGGNLNGGDTNEVKLEDPKSGRLQSEQEQQQKQQKLLTKSESKPSKLRQLLHLDSRSKDRTSKLITANEQTTRPLETEDTTSASEPVIFVSNGSEDNCKSSSSGRLPMSAIAGGYYAYSPVVQSTSELKLKSGTENVAAKKQLLPREKSGNTNNNGNNKSGAKKSWLLSKFSLSSSNINNADTTAVRQAEAQTKLHSMDYDTSKPIPVFDAQTSGGSVTPMSSALLGPERKAELITISDSDLHKVTKGASAISNNGDSDEAEEQGLIRPKSALSSTNADLIAAQKSLAAAAAAKVKRDKMFKMPYLDDGLQTVAGSQQVASELETKVTSNKECEQLTVKTSEPFWTHHGQPLVVANSTGGGLKYMIGQALVKHRSGTNSVGMSDTSPSNNGAESDNSLQTTTGSMSTDNTSGGQPTVSEHQNSSPLGILSRILLNNSNNKSNMSCNNSNSCSGQNTNITRQVAEDLTNSSGSTLRNGKTTGNIGSSSLSSSTLSSPASNKDNDHDNNSNKNNNNNHPLEMGSNNQATQKLDQMGSRSRCPIVMVRSNDLPSEKETITNEPTSAPKLPSKSAIKVVGSRLYKPEDEGELDSRNKSTVLVESMNGLPRVPSYKQISSSASVDRLPTYTQHNGSAVIHTAAAAARQQQSLCNYHAINRVNHLVQTSSYSPYPAYALSRYSNTHELYHEPMTGGNKCPAQMQHQQHLHHLSQQNLRSGHIDAASLDLTLPATAVNYEYYLDTPAAYPNQHISQSTGARYHYTANDGDIIYPNYTQDDSIYISYLNDRHHQIRDTTSSLQKGAVANGVLSSTVNGKTTFTMANDLIRSKQPTAHNHHHYPFNHINVNQSHHHHQTAHHQQQRPKSSLDTFLIPNVNSASNGRLSATQNGDIDRVSTQTANDRVQNPHRLPLVTSNSHLTINSSDYSNSIMQSTQKQQAIPPYYTALAYSSSPYRHYLYPENSIYASNQSADFHHRSDLTVLPTTDSYQQSSSVKALTGGGSDGDGNGEDAAQINSSRLIQTPIASLRQQDRNSWTPTPYKSLVQVNQSSPSKSNQSSKKPDENSTPPIISGDHSVNSLLNTNIVDGRLTSSPGNIVKVPTKVFISNKQIEQTEPKINLYGSFSVSLSPSSTTQLYEECNDSTVL